MPETVAIAFKASNAHLKLLVGEDHAATRAIYTAHSIVGSQSRKGTRQRDDRTRDAVLRSSHWDPFRVIDATQSMPIQQLRAIDRFLAFSTKHGAGAEAEDFLLFVADQDSSMLLRTLRKGFENLLTPAHPAVMAIEEARSRKEADRYARRKPKNERIATPRPLTKSVLRSELPADWLRLLDDLQSGKSIRGKKLAKKSIENMSTAARQLLFSARQNGLPDSITLDTIRAYDQTLEANETTATSRTILFNSIRTLAKRLNLESSILTDLQELVSYYERRSKSVVKKKERRLADLPDLKSIFERANALLDEAPTVLDRRKRTTQYVDAAALAFLSLIPLRNQDTSLRWGRHILYIGDDDPADWGLDDGNLQHSYYLDLRTSKTDAGLSGPLAPILTPFLDALILRGQDERLLPVLRATAMEARGPVIPNNNGSARGVRSLSERWRAQIGTGSGISRTRIHSLLGALGEHGTRAALALCAQGSPRTAIWYQADSLASRRMLESQEMVAELIEMGAEEEYLVGRLQSGVGSTKAHLAGDNFSALET